MRKYFGTDGIRGVANIQLDALLAFKCGNALAAMKPKAKIVMGTDTRRSCDMIASALSAGVMAGGGDVCFLGIVPTACVAFVTREQGADYGVVISASHNPEEYNGIKIFGGDGYKLPDKEELEVERNLGKEYFVEPDQIGKQQFCFEAKESYVKNLASASKGLKGLKIVLDMSNGAAFEVAPEVFTRLGATVVAMHADKNGGINKNCGCLHPEGIKEKVLKEKADMGIAFDGDSDRLVVVDKEGNLINGDMILYILANFYKEQCMLAKNTVVGTKHTNMGIEKAFEEQGIKFLRADIGDKYVIAQMRKTGAVLGGEQSGHIIVGTHSTTGDGVLTGVILCEVVKRTGKSLSSLCDVEQYPQQNINIRIDDKNKVMNSKKLKDIVAEMEEKIGSEGRVMVRASGTEPKIRITAECRDEKLAKQVAKTLAEGINDIANMEN